MWSFGFEEPNFPASPLNINVLPTSWRCWSKTHYLEGEKLTSFYLQDVLERFKSVTVNCVFITAPNTPGLLDNHALSCPLGAVHILCQPPRGGGGGG